MSADGLIVHRVLGGPTALLGKQASPARLLGVHLSH